MASSPRAVVWCHNRAMSGMPAWEFRLAEQDLWALVAFSGKLPLATLR